MERVQTLIEKLQQQLQANATARQLLLTAQMLQQELLHLQQQEPVLKESVVVAIPANIASAAPIKESTPIPQVTPKQEEKIVEVLKVDEAALEAELEEIKRNAVLMQQISGHSKPQRIYNDPIEEDIPTLSRQQPVAVKEIHEVISVESSASLNDRLKTDTAEISHKLTEQPIRDLKKAIGINDRFLFINELFRGDEAMYERSIKTINSFSIFPEAEYWIRRELKTKLGWTNDNPTVAHFDQLVKRRFS